MANFISNQITPSAGGGASIAHGLGGAPDFVDFVLECVTAEHGWAVGDRIRPIQPNPTSSAQGAVVVADATNITYRFGNNAAGGVFRAVQNSGSFLPVSLTNNSWRVRFIAVRNPLGAGGFTSALQTISSMGSFTLNHGLAAAPRNVHFALVCQTAEHGYSVNDVVWPCGFTGGTSARGVATRLTATQILGRYLNTANPFSALNKTTGALVTLTNANWRLRIFAYVGGTNYNGIAIAVGGAISNLAWPAANPYMNENFTCATAEFSYAVNDIVAFGWFIAPSTNSGAAGARNPASGRYGSGVGTSPIALIRNDTFTIAAMTPNNWRMNHYSDNP